MSLRPFVLVAASLEGARAGTRVELDDDTTRHLRTVLRLRAGAEVEVTDGDGWRAEAALEGSAATLTAPAERDRAPGAPLLLAQAVPKARRFDEVVRQVTELGVDAIVPVEAARGVVRLRGEDKREAARARWEAVARAACAQARRSRVPEVAPPCSSAALVEVLDGRDDQVTLLVAHPGGDGPQAVLEDVTGGVAVAVGPEGGWTDDEVELLLAAGGRCLGLGPTVLRTEHAGAAALAAVAAVLGRFEGDDVRSARSAVHGP